MKLIFIIILFPIYSIFATNSLDFRFLSYNGMFKNKIDLINFFCLVESVKNIQIYENGDEAFDAIVIDQEKNQIIIGAK